MILSKVLSLKFLPLVKSDFKTLINMFTFGKTDWWDQKKLNVFFIKLNDGAGFVNNLNAPRCLDQIYVDEAVRHWDRDRVHWHSPFCNVLSAGGLLGVRVASGQQSTMILLCSAIRENYVNEISVREECSTCKIK